ncbi:unnamed protein product, partial [Hymenolepis diminuta]|uniref:UNC93-like protein MFSD11 n=1 Tax=Hymenolepis diminuta TaxID=6216 RepID=A0A0R3STT3_HYMDI
GSVLEEARLEKDPSFTASGYISLSIVYASCAIFNWTSPTIVSWLKPKMAMFVGALTYLLVSFLCSFSRLFLAAFIEPITWLIYLASALLGFGAAVIWTAQDVFIIACSTDNNLNRNFGLFWIIFQTELYLIATVAILSGLNDSLWSTQISALIGKAYPTYSDPNITAAAFALFKCIQSILSAVAFFYSTVLNLHWQVLIFQIFAILEIIGFTYVENTVSKSPSTELSAVSQAKPKGF